MMSLERLQYLVEKYEEMRMEYKIAKKFKCSSKKEQTKKEYNFLKAWLWDEKYITEEYYCILSNLKPENDSEIKAKQLDRNECWQKLILLEVLDK